MKRRQRLFAGMLCVALSVTNVLSEGFWVEASGLEQQEFVESMEEADEDGTEIDIPESSEVESDVEEDFSEGNVVYTEEEDGVIEEEAVTETGTGEEETGKEETTEENIKTEVQTEDGTEEEAGSEAVEEETEYGLDIVNSEDNIASGKSNDITWVIDKDGKLTVEGTGDFAVSTTDENDEKAIRVPWYDYRTSIIAAEVNVTDMTDASYIFYECENMIKIDLQGFDTSKVTNMSRMFYRCAGLISLDLSGFVTDSVTDMSNMFGGCEHLTSLDLSNFNTSNVINMNGMFFSCFSLSSLDVSKFDTHNVTNMCCLFYLCERLTSLNVSNFDTKKVKYMNDMFAYCSDLEQLDVSGFETGNVISTAGMFHDCSRLTSLNVRGFDTRNVVNMRNMFSGCSSLEQLDVSGFDTKKVTDMCGMFFECCSLEWLDVSGFSTQNVEDMSGMFVGCIFLTSVDVGGFNTQNVRKAGSMFEYCSDLVNIDLSSINLENIEEEIDAEYSLANMFKNCSSLTTIYTPYNLSRQVTLPSGSWYQPDGTEITELPLNLDYSIMISKGNAPIITDSHIEVHKEKRVYECGDTLNIDDLTVKYYSIDGIVKKVDDYTTNIAEIDMSVPGEKILTITYNGMKAIVELSVETFSDDMASGNYEDIIWKIDSNGKLTVTGKGEFADINSLLRKKTPWYDSRESIITAEINVTDMTNASYMFADCFNLTSVNFAEFDTRNVKNMEGMFIGCNSLPEVDFSGVDTTNVTNMNYMFAECNSLIEVNLDGFNTGNVTQMRYMFSGCSNLMNIDVSGFDTENVTNMACMFMGCSNLMSIDVSGFNTENVTDMYGMLNGCSNLVNVDVSGFDTNKVTNMSNMFSFCSNLVSVDVSGFDTSKVIYMAWMFGWCSNLTSLDVSNFDTSKATSMEYMFAYCSNLTSLDVSGFYTKNVKNMEGMFWSCSNLISLDVSGFDTRNVTSMGYMFAGCSNLSNLDVSSFDTSKVTSMGYIFTDCSHLISLDVSSFDTSKVTSMEAMFCLCSNLISLDVSGFDTSKVTNMNRMFAGCDNLVSLDVSRFNTEKVTNMYRIFFDCSKLTSLDLSNFTIQDETAGINTILEDCTSLNILYTPCNLNQQVSLPAETWYQPDGTEVTEFWYKPDGTKIAELPLNVDYSIIISKSKVPVITDSYIIAYKKTRIYECGATLNTDDITVRYYATDGTVKKVTGYKTNASKIDMSTVGTKSLLVTYNGLTSEIPITVRQYFTVIFDFAGHGSPIEPLTGITAGSLIDMPPIQSVEGYDFWGWYKDIGHTQRWNFISDTVEDNIILYAYWHSSSVITEPSYTQSGNLLIQEIPTLTYTGSALKPAVTVYYQSEDRKILLTSGKDYTVKYCNNIHADTEKEKELGGIGKTETDNSSGFTKDLAYLVITCKGNYKGTVYQNFHISPAGITTGGQNIAKGFTLKYTEQFVSGNKALKPFSSLKYKKAMKAGTDYTVQLTAEKAYDADRTALKKGSIIDGNNTIPTIPAGYQGTFLLTITGKNNYRGTITKNIYVTDKNHLMKNASVTIGKNQKSMRFTGSGINLTPAWFDDSEKKYYAISEAGIRTEADKNNVFTVKIGKEYLLYGKDFTISYSNNRAVGKATMTIIGIGDYIGTKNVTFRITGTAFNTKNIGLEKFKSSLTYTGQMLTQNEVILKDISSANPVGLVCGTDYTVSYKNNLKKGTATMTFTANPSSGYSGSFKKTFKIVPAGLNKITTVDTTDPFKDKIVSENGSWKLESQIIYTKEGAKPSNCIILTNRNNNVVLKEGTDYTVSYANNKTVSTAEKPAVMIVKGKGNYTGNINISFPIVKASLEGNENVTVNATAIAYNAKKTEEYQYRPQIKITDKKKGLSASKDYEIVEYRNCSSAAVKTYLDALANGTATADIRPYVLIRAREESGYKGSMEVDLTIYQTKLTSKNLYVVISSKREQITYTGVQVKPEVTVYFGESESIKQAKKAGEVREAVLTDKTGDYKLKKLNLKENGIGDYTLTYGSNVTAGKNKGSVMINGAGLYGGRVTVKFTILGKDVHNQ